MVDMGVMFCFWKLQVNFLSNFGSSVSFSLLKIHKEFDQYTKTWGVIVAQVLLQSTFTFLLELHH